MVKRNRNCFVHALTPEALVDLYFNVSDREREKNFATPQRVGLLLKKDETTVRQWAREGKILFVKIGGTMLIYMPSVVDWLKATTAAA